MRPFAPDFYGTKAELSIEGPDQLSYVWCHWQHRYLEGGGTLGDAQPLAAHAGPRATKLYDLPGDAMLEICSGILTVTS